MHLFLIKTFLLEQDDLLFKNCSIMKKVNTNVLLNEPLIMHYMLNHVLSHYLDQMSNDQKLSLVNDV